MLRKHQADETKFKETGELLHNVYDAHVKRDDSFYLTFKTSDVQSVQMGDIISAHTPDAQNNVGGLNQFRVWDITKRMGYIEVEALHLIYDLDKKLVKPFNVNQSSCQLVLNGFKKNLTTPSRFTFASSITTNKSFRSSLPMQKKDRPDPFDNAFDVFMGGDKSIVGTFGAELELNGYDVRLVNKLGKRTNALIYEKKNISDYEDAHSSKKLVTRIYATSTFRPEDAKENDEDVELSVTVDSPLINDYDQVYETHISNDNIRTEKELRQWAEEHFRAGIDKPERHIKVESNIIDGTEINYGDDVIIRYVQHGVDDEIRCCGYDYDPIGRVFYSITLGSNDGFSGNSITSHFSNSIDDATKQVMEIMEHGLDTNITRTRMAANGINKNTWGWVEPSDPIEGDTWFKFDPDRPDELAIYEYRDGEWVLLVDMYTKQRIEEKVDNTLAHMEELKDKHNQKFEDVQKEFEATNQRIDREVAESLAAIPTDEEITAMINAADFVRPKELESVRKTIPSNSEINELIQKANLTTNPSIQSTVTKLNEVIDLKIENTETDLTSRMTLMDGNLTSKISSTRDDLKEWTGTQIGQSENKILTQVKGNEDKIASLEINVNGLQSNVETKADKSHITQLSNLINSKVTDAEKDFQSRLTQTARSLEVKISNLPTEREIEQAIGTRVSVTERVLKAQIQDANKNISDVEQTAERILSTVFNHDAKNQSQFTQLSNMINSRVTNGQMQTQIQQSADSLRLLVETDIDRKIRNQNVIYTNDGSTTEYNSFVINPGFYVKRGQWYEVTISLRSDTDGARAQVTTSELNSNRLKSGGSDIKSISHVAGFSFTQFTHRFQAEDFGGLKIAVRRTAGTAGRLTYGGVRVEEMADIHAEQVKTEINMSTDGVRITGKNIYLDGNTTIANGVIGTAHIKDAAISSAKIANAAISSAKISYVDVGKISGLTSQFVQSRWNAINSDVSIDGTGINIKQDNGYKVALSSRGLNAYDRNNNRVGALATTVWESSDEPAGWAFSASKNFDITLGYIEEKPGVSLHRPTFRINGDNGHVVFHTAFSGGRSPWRRMRIFHPVVNGHSCVGFRDDVTPMGICWHGSEMFFYLRGSYYSVNRLLEKNGWSNI